MTIISVIVDNKACNGIRGEWGLSILVEYAEKKILLDAGASNLFLDNMKRLGVNIEEIDYATLSHAHYDHVAISVLSDEYRAAFPIAKFGNLVGVL